MVIELLQPRVRHLRVSKVNSTREWQVDDRAKEALSELILSRAAWTADRIDLGWPSA
jgi:hypothetical protein